MKTFNEFVNEVSLDKNTKKFIDSIYKKITDKTFSFILDEFIKESDKKNRNAKITEADYLIKKISAEFAIRSKNLKDIKSNQPLLR